MARRYRRNRASRASSNSNRRATLFAALTFMAITLSLLRPRKLLPQRIYDGLGNVSAFRSALAPLRFDPRAIRRHRRPAWPRPCARGMRKEWPRPRRSRITQGGYGRVRQELAAQGNPGNRGKENGGNLSNGSSQSARKNTTIVTAEQAANSTTSSLI